MIFLWFRKQIVLKVLQWLLLTYLGPLVVGSELRGLNQDNYSLFTRHTQSNSFQVDYRAARPRLGTKIQNNTSKNTQEKITK